MKKVGVLIAILLVALFSVVAYPLLSKDLQFSPSKEKTVYSLLKESTDAKQKARLCDSFDKFLDSIGSCRTRYAGALARCNPKDEGCAKEVAEVLRDCISGAAKSYCPNIL